jgi:hypothetical protein
MARFVTIPTHRTPDAQGGQGPETQKQKIVGAEARESMLKGDFAKGFERGKLSQVTPYKCDPSSAVGGKFSKRLKRLTVGA